MKIVIIYSPSCLSKPVLYDFLYSTKEDIKWIVQAVFKDQDFHPTENNMMVILL